MRSASDGGVAAARDGGEATASDGGEAAARVMEAVLQRQQRSDVVHLTRVAVYEIW